MNNRYLKKLCSIANEKLRSDQEIWYIFCQFYCSEQQSQSPTLFSNSSDAYTTIAKDYAKKLEEKNTEKEEKHDKLFTYLNTQFATKPFDPRHTFAELLTTFLNCYPNPEYIQSLNNIADSLKLKPRMPVDEKYINFVAEKLVTKALKDESDWVREAAIDTLGALIPHLPGLPDKNKQFFLITSALGTVLAEDNSEGVKTAASNVLDILTGPLKITESRQDELKDIRVLNIFESCLLDKNKRTLNIGKIVNFGFAEKRSQEVKIKAIEILNSIKPPFSGEDKEIILLAIISIFTENKYQDEAVINAAIHMFGDFIRYLSSEEKKTVIKELISRLEKSESSKLMQAIIAALDILASDLSDEDQTTVIKKLITKLTHQELAVRQAAAETLGALPASLFFLRKNKQMVIPALIAGLEQNKSNVEVTEAKHTRVIAVEDTQGVDAVAHTLCFFEPCFSGEDRKNAATKLAESFLIFLRKTPDEFGPLLNNIENLIGALGVFGDSLSGKDKTMILETSIMQLKDKRYMARKMARDALGILAPHFSKEDRKNVVTKLLAVAFAEGSDFTTIKDALSTLCAFIPYLSDEKEEINLMTMLIEKFTDQDQKCRQSVIDTFCVLMACTSAANKKIVVDNKEIEMAEHALKALTPILRDENHRNAAIKALGVLAPYLSEENKITAITELLTRLTDSHSTVRTSIAMALKNYIAHASPDQQKTFLDMIFTHFKTFLKSGEIAAMDTIYQLLNNINETQENYFIYGLMLNEILNEEPQDFSLLLHMCMLRICADHANDFKKKETLGKFLPVKEVAELVAAYSRRTP